MAEKNRSVVMDYLVYLLMRVVICILQALPFTLACRLADLLAWLAYHVDKRHRLVAQENLRHAFPGQLTDAKLDAMVRRVYRHFFLLLMEILFMPRLVRISNWKNHLFYEEEHIARLLNTVMLGRPTLLATGHFGNWELSLFVLGLLGFNFHGIARPLDNPFVDRYMLRLREFHGQKILAKKGDFDQIQEVLAKGGILGTIADQDAGPRGLFVDFFNRPASTHKAVALLSLEHKVPIVVLASIRTGGPLQYQGVVEDVIFPEEYEGRPDGVKAITQRYTAALERLVRRAPDQYFWLHRRWKHQPQAKAKKRAA